MINLYSLSYFNHTVAGRITAVKGIRIEYKPNEDAVKLLKRYTAIVQEFLDIGKLNEHRKEVVQEYRLAGMNILFWPMKAL